MTVNTKYNPDKHHRRSIRLCGYDYAQDGLYFVTICCQGRVCLFGEIVNGEMALNDAGRMVEQWHYKTAEKFSHIRCLDMVVMPNRTQTLRNTLPTILPLGRMIFSLLNEQNKRITTNI